MKIGALKKLKTQHKDIVQYILPLGSDNILLNDLIGQKISLKHTGRKFCVDTGKEIKKTYGQGYSWDSFITLPECDSCIFKPELCHYAKGTCRDESWGEDHCLQAHVIYLSLTSGVKIGITRKTQVPTRWMDQGAVSAIKLCEVKDRLTSGKIEVEIAKEMADKTNWRNMLKNNYPEVDLKQEKKKIISAHKDMFEKYAVTICDDEIYQFNYPVETYPEKVSALNFDKKALINDELMGIKGQYLIFKSGVINIRKFQGYEVELDY